MLKELFDKGKCLVGLHDGEWSFKKKKDCTRVRICVRCGTQSEKVEHNLGEWAYVAEGDCDQQQTCLRCDETSHREVHEWQEPQRRSEESCEQVIVCSRCKAEQEGPLSHLWGEWEYVTKDACGQIQTCERCGASGAKRTEHLWGEWYHSEQHGGAVHVCRRCGELARSLQSQILAVISSISKAQAQPSAPREIAAPTASQAEPASDERAEMFERLKSQMNKRDDPQDVPSLAQLEDMHAALKKQYEEIDAQVNRLSATGSVPPGLELMRAAAAKHYEEINAQMNQLKRQESAPTRAAATGNAKPQVERDPRLVGHWRFTEANFGVTDYHRVMNADGSFTDSSHSCSQFGESRTGPEPGKWRTGNKILYLSYSDGRSLTLQYHLENGTLFFPEASVQRLWERVQ